MIIKVITRDPINGELVTSSETLNNMNDYFRLRAACVCSSRAWLNELQIVSNGCVEVYAYNHAESIVQYLLGEISIGELYDRIEK